MPKPLLAHPPPDADEKHKLRKPAGARHAPGDWIWDDHHPSPAPSAARSSTGCEERSTRTVRELPSG